MANYRRNVSRGPVGSITPIGNGWGKDESGRLFNLETVEYVEQKRKEAYKKRDRRHFTFAHMKNMREVTDNLSSKLCGYVLLLQPYIQYKTNLLTTQGRNPEPLDDKGIAGVIDLHPRNAKTAISNLKDAGVLEVTEKGYYRINDRYHFRKKAGGEADMLIKTFHTTLKQLKLKPAEMGFIYKLMPYVHYETNLICANPFEEAPQDVRYLNKRQIGETVGMSRNKVDDTLRSLKKAGALVTVERRAMDLDDADNDGRDTLVILNPRMFSRLRGEHDKAILQFFAGLI